MEAMSQTQIESFISAFNALSESYRSGYNDGYARAIAEIAHRERNGGTDPEFHSCHFCGESVANGYDCDNKRHWLSDCRPDLVEHEPGEKCTWNGVTDVERDCYAFQAADGDWTDKHEHFMKDGPL